eukprot:gene20861-25015_t
MLTSFAVTEIKVLLKEREVEARKIAVKISKEYQLYKDAGEGKKACEGYNACSDSLSVSICDPDYGSTEGCDCAGRAVSKGVSVVKESSKVSTFTEITQVACYTQNLQSTFRTLDEEAEGSLKWIYYGSVEGVLVNYPGILWEREANKDCSPEYDPTFRPWYVQGATGPKNVVVIIDQSGSMKGFDRMQNAIEAAVSVVEGLVHTDYLSVVAFGSYATSPNSYLVPASESYRKSVVSWIKSLEPYGNTCFKCGFTKAFEILRRSEAQSFSAGCNTAILFLTDGDPTDSLPNTIAYINEQRVDTQYLFYYTLGSGVTKDLVRQMACGTDGVYKHVDDGDSFDLRQAFGSYTRVFSAMLAEAQVSNVAYSEPYYSVPDIFGEVTSVVVPVYDNSSTPWVFLGVASADVPVCVLERLVTDDMHSDSATTGDTVQGCTCLSSYTYDGKSFEGCTTYDWSSAWCGTESCGICDEQVTPGGCWDICQPNENLAVVEDLLRNLSAVCATTTRPSACTLEALRGSETCGVCGVEDRALLTPAILATSDSTWEADGYSATDDTRNDDLCDSRFSNEVCYECPASMTPSCTKEKCETAVKNRQESDKAGVCSSGSSETDVVLIVCVILAVVLASLVVFFVCRKYFKRKSAPMGDGGRASVELESTDHNNIPVAMPVN